MRGSDQLTALVREVRYRCDNDECGHQFVAHIEIIRTVQPSMQPRPDIFLPLATRKAANDDRVVPLPANDPANDDRPGDHPAAHMT